MFIVILKNTPILLSCFWFPMALCSSAHFSKIQLTIEMSTLTNQVLPEPELNYGKVTTHDKRKQDDEQNSSL